MEKHSDGMTKFHYKGRIISVPDDIIADIDKMVAPYTANAEIDPAVRPRLLKSGEVFEKVEFLDSTYNLSVGIIADVKLILAPHISLNIEDASDSPVTDTLPDGDVVVEESSPTAPTPDADPAPTGPSTGAGREPFTTGGNGS